MCHENGPDGRRLVLTIAGSVKMRKEKMSQKASGRGIAWFVGKFLGFWDECSPWEPENGKMIAIFPSL